MSAPPPNLIAPPAAGVHKSAAAIQDLLAVMARLRAPDGCPWDREQDHRTLRFHAVEEAYELMDAIEAGDDPEMAEELGDLLLQVVFHCQLARERGAFDFEAVARRVTEKLIRRHPHVFGETKVRNVEEVWTNWEIIKKAEKHGTRHARSSALDGIPRHLPALLRAEKLVKKARKAKLLPAVAVASKPAITRGTLSRRLFELAARAQARGWSAEDLLRSETRRRERQLRKEEKVRSA
jgi:uncharacterized protein YabN with tetrapyrrole methylase and pyrophosphatase domain